MAARVADSTLWHLDLDQLCCGVLGVSYALSEAATLLGSQELADRAAIINSQVLCKARANNGRYSLGWGNELVPSFHQGLSGIGYHYLRAGADTNLPDLLSWE